MKSELRFICGIVLLIALSTMGYIRDEFLIDLFSRNSVVLDRAGEIRYRMPTSIEDIDSSLAANPKWASAALYTLLYAILSAGCIALFFSKRSYVFITLTVHAAIILLIVLIIVTGLIFHSFGTAYQLSEYLKNLIQSPLLTLILAAGFLLAKKLI